MATLEVIDADNIQQNAKTIGTYMKNRFLELQEKQILIGEVRGLGLMLGVELVRDRKTKEPLAPDDPRLKALTRYCVEHGVLIRCVGHKLILSPPLTFTRANADEAIEVIDKAFASLPARRG